MTAASHFFGKFSCVDRENTMLSRLKLRLSRLKRWFSRVNRLKCRFYFLRPLLLPYIFSLPISLPPKYIVLLPYRRLHLFPRWKPTKCSVRLPPLHPFLPLNVSQCQSPHSLTLSLTLRSIPHDIHVLVILLPIIPHEVICE